MGKRLSCFACLLFFPYSTVASSPFIGLGSGSKGKAERLGTGFKPKRITFVKESKALNKGKASTNPLLGKRSNLQLD